MSEASDPIIQRHNGVWYMVVGDQASPLDGVTAAILNAKLARMTEAQRMANPTERMPS